MSALTKKQILVDRTIASLAGVREGTLVSYAQLTKAMHEYIKKNKLRKGEEELASLASAPPAPAVKYCSACGTAIPGSAVYCDNCGEKQ